jgi:hypothetical protein
MIGATPPPMTDAAGVAHYTISYPFANTVGCSCSWVRRDVPENAHEDLIVEHLASVGL